METRLIKEYLGSNDTGNIKVGQGLIFKGAEDGSADGLFMRVDANGNVIGYKAVDQDIEWTETVENDITIGGTETFIIGLTVDHDITSENGSYAFSAKLKNGSSARADNITLVVRDGDGNALASKMVSIDKGEEAFPATFYGEFKNEHPSGTTFNVYAYGSNNSIARGTLTPIGLKVIEAQAAPVSAMATAERALVLPSEVTSPQKQDFLTALGAIGEAELVKNDFTALATNGEKYLQVFYSHALDEFFSSPLVLASGNARPDIAQGSTLHATVSFGTGISRGEIENLITDRGYNLPTKDITFYARDANDKVWFCHYLKAVDKYAVEKLNLK